MGTGDKARSVNGLMASVVAPSRNGRSAAGCGLNGPKPDVMRHRAKIDPTETVAAKFAVMYNQSRPKALDGLPKYHRPVLRRGRPTPTILRTHQ